MNIEEIQEFKEKINKEFIYFNNIDFPILAGKFKSVVDFLSKIEEEVARQLNSTQSEDAAGEEKNI